MGVIRVIHPPLSRERIIMKKLIHTQNVAAIKSAMTRFNYVYVDIILGIDRHPFGNVAQPDMSHQREIQMAEDANMQIVTINLGGNAAKYCDIDIVTGDLVFDVGMGGKPFMGNIPAGHVLRMAVGDTVDSLVGVPTPCGLEYIMTESNVAEGATEAVSRPQDAPARKAWTPSIVK
ncbi:hypothetical protein NVP1244A_127 [Vibrio phage 1.244.A._10N.261.54.C3]|nr:hypothetical protein NVP1244A_127 [Vibrio phage 1.244.A._10N.261.54.C3]AUR98755.1 hypothetical protein NVP1255O_127 [Vibrio phage 1.255.O._10N.286.45.F1]